eukprot:g4543.t3
MLRRLVRRFSEEGGGVGEGPTGVDGSAAAATAAGGGAGGISQKVVEEIELDVDSEEDETERWIMAAGGSAEPTGGLGRDGRVSGRRVWVPDDKDVWRTEAVLSESADGNSYTVLAKGGKGEVEIPVGDCAEYDPSHALDLPDASRMNQMHEAPLLNLLRRRFDANNIYTNVADVLVSINPYTDIPGLYDIPMPVSKPISGLLPGLNVTVRGPSAGGRVAERSAALMREFNDGREDYGGNKSAVGRRGHKKLSPSRAGGAAKGHEEPATPKSQLTALKSMLGKPHVYGVADRAFKYMAETKGREVDGRIRCRNQSILITGESGAGKTEASKHVMRFLITASRALAGTAPPAAPSASSGSASPSSGGGGVSEGGKWRSNSPVAAAAAAAKHMEDVLLRSNTVLEAFGNAKTVRNDNSSRFGKYIKLQYDGDFRLVGARTEHFLLEKSRLVHLEDSERSYHILYQVAKALPPAERRAFHLAGGAESFSLLNQGNCLEASDDVDDHQEFDAVDKALSSLDFSREEKTNMWRLLAAVLHSGQVRFEDVPGQEQCRIFKGRGTGSLSPAALAALWGVDQAVFETGVMRRTVTAGGTSASVKLNAAQARENLLALLKHMYRQLFAWINWKINVVFDVPTAAKGGSSSGAERTFIGILDIFGFEIMATNSFEQLCINFANEVLQRQFNHHIFVLEQEEYGEEGLDVASIPFRDNQRIIDLIAKRPAGLMQILEDQALTGRKAASLGPSSFTDKNLLELFHQQHHRKSPHPCYRKPRFDGPEFVIMHYAGDVTYCATGFLEKNNDTLQEDLRGLLLSSRIPFLRQLILGEGGDFQKQDDDNASLASGGDGPATTIDASSQGGAPPRARPPANVGGGLPPPVTFTTPNAVSKRVSYPCADGGSATETAGGGGGGSGSGGGGGGGRSLKSTRIAAKATVSNAFRSQLDDLVAQLGETEPHYIKCIKPNAGKAPGGWASPLVIDQLRYSGVLEVVRIRREAFPMRVTYKQFYRRFGNLLTSKGMPPADEVTSAKAREAALQICEAVFGAQDGRRSAYQMGKTKIFLRDDGLKRLRAALRLHYFSLAAKIQALWRGATVRAWLSRQHEAASRLQKIARGNSARRRFHEIQQATKVLQAVARMRRARALVKRKQASAVKVQAVWRGWSQRQWEKRIASATRVQAVARGFVVRKRQERIEAATTLQVIVSAVVRGVQARRRCQAYRESIVALQAASRGMATRKAIAEMKAKEQARRAAAATRIEAAWRGKSERLFGPGKREAKRQAENYVWALREAYLKEESSASRIQRAVRAFLRNQRLRSRSIETFRAARSGDVAAVARHLSEWPLVLFLRDRYDVDEGEGNDGGGHQTKGVPSYSTLLHAACEGGTVEIVALLEPFLSDITAIDRWGNTPVHVAAEGCKYDLLKFLARRANLDTNKAVRAAANGHPAPRPEAFPVGMSMEAFGLAAGMVRRLRLAKAAAPAPSGSRRGVRRRGEDGEAEAGEVEEGSCCASGRGEQLEGEGGSAAVDDESGDGDGDGGGRGGSGVGDGEGVGSLRTESWEGGRPMVEGFLKKRRETARWLKRWCQLKRHAPRAGETGPALFYFRKKTDDMPRKVIMLHHCLLKKSEALNFAFELHSPLMVEGKNKEGRLYFQAGNEVELQQWLVALRTLVKFYDFNNEKRQLPMEYLDRGTRERLVRAKNDLGETPLHLAVSFTVPPASGGGGGGSSRHASKQEADLAVQRIAAWLIESGASANACDDDGETPMHRVMKAGHVDAALALHKRRGNVNLPRKTDWKTPLDLAAGSGEVWQRLRKEAAAVAAPKQTVGSSSDAALAAGAAGTAVPPLLPAPTRLPGFTYVSVFLEALSVASAAGMGNPSLSLSVFSAKGQLVEAAQNIDSPAFQTSSGLWWGRTWHMQTPLETLGSGSSMVFELRDGQGGSNNKAICWGALPLDPDHLNTQPEQLTTYLAPTDPVRLMKARDRELDPAQSAGCYGVVAGVGGSSSSSLPLRTDVALSAEGLGGGGHA